MGRRKKSEQTPQQFNLMEDFVSEESKSSSTKSYEISSDYVVRKYVGRTTSGYIHNHKYVVKLSKNSDVGYSVFAIRDMTSGEDVDVGIRIVNETSWEHFFKSAN